MSCNYCVVDVARVACSQCLTQVYCSDACASEDWATHHHQVCGAPIGNVTTLDSLMARVYAFERPTTVEGWVRLRNVLSESDASLQREIDAYRVTQQEVEERIEDVVFLTNLTSMGPIVLRSPGKGYGLFADRTYRGSLDSKGDYVTTYDGARIKDSVGPYVLRLSNNAAIDGHHGFELINKGRWINNDDDDFNVYFAANKIYVYTSEYEFDRAPRIKMGSELLINYGNEYEKSWEEDDALRGRGTEDDPYILY